jgi:hypothetical protein
LRNRNNLPTTIPTKLPRDNTATLCIAIFVVFQVTVRVFDVHISLFDHVVCAAEASAGTLAVIAKRRYKHMKRETVRTEAWSKEVVGNVPVAYHRLRR